MNKMWTAVPLGMGLVFPLLAQGLAYVGIHTPGETWVYETTTRDSVYLIDPATGQPFMALGGTFSMLDDSLWVLDTFTVEETFMYGVEEQVPRLSNPSQKYRERYGTWEVGDAVYRDIRVPQRRFVTPFTPGNVWRQYPAMPLNRWVPVDVDGDGDLDTLFLENDSVRVVGQDVVTVPAGTYTAWHLLTWSSRRIRYSEDSATNTLDSVVWMEETHAWWVPNFGMIRDSSHLIISEYGVFLDTVVVGKRQPIVRILLSSTPVQEPVPPRPQPRALKVQVQPGRLHLVPLEPGARVRIQDLLGRVRFTGKLMVPTSVSLPKGVYILTDGKTRISVVIP